MYLKYYIQSFDGKFHHIEHDKNIPIFTDKERLGTGIILVRNVSNFYLNSITIGYDGTLPDYIMSAVHTTSTDVSSSDLTAGINHSYTTLPFLKTLYPGESFLIHIQSKTSQPNFLNEPDVDIFNLRVSFKPWYFPTENCIAAYSFEDQYGASLANDSINSVSAAVTEGVPFSYVLKGVSKAIFSNDGDQIECPLSAGLDSSGATLFIKAFVTNSNKAELVNLTHDGDIAIQVGLLESRHLYFYVGGGAEGYLVSKAKFESVSEEAIFGFAFEITTDNITKVLISLNGQPLELMTENEVTEMGLTYFDGGSCTEITTAILGGIGSQFYGAVSSFIVFSSYKMSAFHKLIFEKLYDK